MDTTRRRIDIAISYTLTTREWVWATARLRPAALAYDSIGAVALLALGVWEADLTYLLVFWALSLAVLSSYLWAPWLVGHATGTLKRATAPTDLQIDETGIAATTDSGTTQTEWGAIKQVREVGSSLAIVRFSGRWRTVPKRAFSPDQLAELKAYLKTDGLLDDRSFVEKFKKIANEGPDS